VRPAVPLLIMASLFAALIHREGNLTRSLPAGGTTSFGILPVSGRGLFVLVRFSSAISSGGCQRPCASTFMSVDRALQQTRIYGAQFGTEAQHERHHRSTWGVIQVADRPRPRRGGCGPHAGHPIDGRDRRAGRDFWAYNGPQSCVGAVHRAMSAITKRLKRADKPRKSQCTS
jgi:hypothetical protein